MTQYELAGKIDYIFEKINSLAEEPGDFEEICEALKEALEEELDAE